MTDEYIFTTRYIYDLGNNYNLYKFQDKIREHVIALIRINKSNNNRICINTMLIKIVSEILTDGYSPYTHFSEEYILNKLTTITLDDIINKGIQWIGRFKLCGCNLFGICNNTLELNYNRNIMYNIIKQHILDYGIIPRCRYILLSYQYYIQEKRVGNTQEIADYDLMLQEIEMDPEEFHNKYKYKVPTKNLSKLVSKTMNDELYKNKDPGCGICQYDIEINHKYYELPCGHLFHENDQECLECATIVFWLKYNKFCPICKKEVIL